VERLYRRGAALAEEIAATVVPPGMVALWFLGQASIALKSGDAVVYVDPYFSDNPHRVYPTPLSTGDLTRADWVFCTHNHLDHLDVATLAPISQRFPTCQFVVPAPHVAVLTGAGIPAGQVHAARAGRRLSWPELAVTPLRAKHEEFEQDANGDHLYLGFVIELDGIRVFHSGDTVGFECQAQDLTPLRPHIAFLPINGRDWYRNRSNVAGNMNYRESLDLAVAAGVDLIVPIHYDLFAGNTENPAFFVDHLYRTAPAQKFKLFAVGERMLYVP